MGRWACRGGDERGIDRTFYLKQNGGERGGLSKEPRLWNKGISADRLLMFRGARLGVTTGSCRNWGSPSTEHKD